MMEPDKIELIRIGVNDAEKLWKMQQEAFTSLYEKYPDTDTSPATEKIDKIQMRLNQSFTYFYFIVVDGEKVGAIRVVDTKEAGNCYLYEKMGYQKTEKIEKINDRMTLVFYRKL